MILETEAKGLKINRGLDFNNSEIRDFKLKDNTFFFPFVSVTGVGEKTAEEIIAYRKEKGEIILLKFAQALEEYGKVELMPKLEGNRMFLFLTPLTKKK